jgi:hypothetical protein
MHHDFPPQDMIQTIASALALATFAALAFAACLLIGAA